MYKVNKMDLINKGKKEEWLKANGGDLAMQLLDTQIDKNFQIAVENDLRNKDFSDVNNVTENGVNDTQTETSTSENVVVEDSNTITDNKVDEEVVNTTETEVVNDVVTESTTKAFVLENPQEFIQLLFTKVINPLRKEVNDLKIEIDTLKKSVSDVTESKVKTHNAIVDLEVISTSSLAALLKSHNSVDSFSEPVKANDPILDSKPKEFTNVSNEQKGTFANFMTGF